MQGVRAGRDSSRERPFRRPKTRARCNLRASDWLFLSALLSSSFALAGGQVALHLLPADATLIARGYYGSLQARWSLHISGHAQSPRGFIVQRPMLSWLVAQCWRVDAIASESGDATEKFVQDR